MKRTYAMTEVCELLGIEQSFVVHCIRCHWVVPAEPAESLLDEEDVARIRLIHELRKDLGVNEEAVPIILHLLDQLYEMRDMMKRAA